MDVGRRLSCATDVKVPADMAANWAKLTPTGKFEYYCLTLQTTPVYLILNSMLAAFLVMLSTFGLLHMRSCPGQPYYPFYLFMLGLTTLAYLWIHYVHRYKMRYTAQLKNKFSFSYSQIFVAVVQFWMLVYGTYRRFNYDNSAETCDSRVLTVSLLVLGAQINTILLVILGFALCCVVMLCYVVKHKSA